MRNPNFQVERWERLVSRCIVSKIRVRGLRVSDHVLIRIDGAIARSLDNN